MFDLRDPHHDQFERLLGRCHPLQAVLERRTAVAILFLRESNYACLMSWHRWEAEQAYSQMVVPHIEAGAPGPLSLDQVAEIAVVRPEERDQ